jgi:hypothetical protein
MPRTRNGALPKTDGDMTIHSPGAYEAVLQKVCSLKAYAESNDDVLLADTAEDMAAINGRRAEHTAVLMKQRHGQPVTCQSWQLPDCLADPFRRWSWPQQSFVVSPDDTITLKTRRK